jgi:hypothetical protein
MKYIQPYDQPSSPLAPYVDLNAVQGVDGSIPPAAFFNVTQAEILNVIIGAGLAPSGTAQNQLYLAILALIPTPGSGPSDAALVHWGIDSSTASNSIVLAPSPVVTTVAPGFTISFVPANTSTGPTTATVTLASGSVTFPILRPDLKALIPGVDVVAGKRMTIIYDGTQFYSGSPAPFVTKFESLSGNGLWVPDPRARVALVAATGGGGSGGVATFGITGLGTGQGGGAGGTDVSLIPLSGVTGVPFSGGIGGAKAVGNGQDGHPGTGTTFGAFLNGTPGLGGFGELAGATRGQAGAGQLGQFRMTGGVGDAAPVGVDANNGVFGGASFWGGPGAGGTPQADAGDGTNGSGGGGGAQASPTGAGGRGGNGVLLIVSS